MNPERWQKIKNILEKAIEAAPDSRDSLLDEACAGDEHLRREVEQLLDFDGATGANAFLEQDAFSAVMRNGDGGKNIVGEQIGHYKIVGELGAGGMGAVYLAERSDGAFEQKAALKLIKRGMDSDAVLRRFVNERQILASLKHPNIAHLVDGGTTEAGLPYFVLEYVEEGEAITDYAARENLDLDERLKLFREVCAAVSFAHSNLVIHRDLKPSNILVTKDGNVKLLDFGIAKLLKSETDGETTATRNFVFTPEYASPEQVRGEKLTTASDVYSLGVILYELLTGARPYQTESKNISEIIRAVCETAPTAPSRVSAERGMQNAKWKSGSENDFGVDNEKRTKKNQRQKTEDGGQKITLHSALRIPHSALRGDLDNIILKALRKEPARRYSSVEQLSEDIRRHQVGLPVTASGDTWSYRALKFIQRNRVGVAAATLVFLTLVGGLTATLYQAKAAQRERAKAEQRFADVRQLANSFLFEFHDAIENLPGSTAARELVVKRAVEYLDKLAAESEGDLTLQRELGTAYAEIGQIQGNSYHSNLGDTEGAMRSYRRSLEIRQRVADADSTKHELQHELADSHEGIGDMLYTVSNLNGGLESYEKALAIREKIVAEEPGNLEYRYALANILGKRGDIKGMEGFPNLGDTAGALESYNRVIALYEELVKAAPDSEKYQSGYATSLHYAGMLKSVTGDAKGAIQDARKGVSIFEQLIAANPNNQKYETHLMSALVFMRYPLLDEGLAEEAVANARRVVQTMEKQVAADPKSVFARRSLGVSYNSLGICLSQANDARGAIENHQKSLAITEELLAADASSMGNRRDAALTLEFLANAQLKADDFDSALVNYRKALAAYEGEKPEDNPDSFASLYAGIGKALAAKGELKEAIENFRRAVPLGFAAAQKSAGNIKTQRRLADYYFEGGKILKRYAQISGNENDRREACDFLQKSFVIWNAMRQAGTINRIQSSRPDEAARELDGCR